MMSHSFETCSDDKAAESSLSYSPSFNDVFDVGVNLLSCQYENALLRGYVELSAAENCKIFVYSRLRVLQTLDPQEIRLHGPGVGSTRRGFGVDE